MRDWSRDALVASGAEEAARGAPLSSDRSRALRLVQHDTTVGLAVWIESPGNTSKELDKNVVVRV